MAEIRIGKVAKHGGADQRFARTKRCEIAGCEAKAGKAEYCEAHRAEAEAIEAELRARLRAGGAL